MIELNKNKLIPGIDVDTSWGYIRGDISKQSDLMSMMSDYLTASSLKTINNQSIVGSGNIEIDASVPDYYATKSWVSDQGYLTSVPSGYATESWVSSQGYLTSETLPSDLATESWVSSQNFATQSWVFDQGYLTSVPSGYATESWVLSQAYITSYALSGYATESWVTSQSYLVSSSLKTINEQSLVGEGDIEIVGLTPEQEAAIEPLEEASNGVLYTRELNKYESQRLPIYIDSSSNSYAAYMYNIDGIIYEMMNNSLYKMNPDNFDFEFVGYFEGSKNSGAPLWSDHTGRIYNGVTNELNFNTLQIDTVDLECSDYVSSWDNNRDSIWKTETGIYNIGTSGVSKFDESLKKFVSWNVTVTEGYTYNQISPWYIPSSGLWYGEHFVWFDEYHMYEMKEYDDHIGIDVLDVPYFPTQINLNHIYCDYVHYIDGELYYLREYNHYKLVDGSWTAISNLGPYFFFTFQSGRGVIYDDYLMIGFEGAYVEYTTTLLNMSDTVKFTYWTEPKQVCVDLSSNQTISGIKNFKGEVNTTNVTINNVSYNTGNTSINLGKNSTTANYIKFTVDGEFSVNEKDIATVDDCIMNKQYVTYGSIVVNVMQPNMDPYYYNYITTHTGRLFCEYMGSSYEFDGTAWNVLSSRLLPNGDTVYGSNVIKSANCTYYVAGQNTYLWNDANSQFELISSTGPGGERWELWICGGDVLRSGSTYKLVDSGGTYSWVDTDPVSGYISGMYHIIDGTVYLLNNFGNVYTYDEATKTYTQIGRYHTWSQNSFSAYGQIFWPYNLSSIYMLDFSKIDGEPDTFIDTISPIPYTNYEFFYGPYNNRLYFYIDYSNFGYCYGEDYVLPEVPASDGTYVLKAVRTSSGVTYSWVADEVSQAVQITNEILS